MDYEVKDATWARWHSCSLCKQQYHGVVRCALGWACWKTYVGRPETDLERRAAIRQLGNGLSAANRDEEALSVREAELSTERRLGASLPGRRRYAQRSPRGLGDARGRGTDCAARAR